MKKLISLLFITILFLTGCNQQETEYENYVPLLQLRDKYIKSGTIPVGSLKWALSTGSKINSSPAIYGNTVIFVNSNGTINALNGLTGAKIWTTPKQLPTKIDEASVEIHNNAIYISGENGVLYSLSLSTGSILWQYPTGSKILSTPIFTKHYVIIPSGDGYLYFISLKSGSLENRVAYNIPLQSSPSMYKGIIYIGGYDGKLYAYDAMNKTIV